MPQVVIVIVRRNTVTSATRRHMAVTINATEGHLGVSRHLNSLIKIFRIGSNFLVLHEYRMLVSFSDHRKLYVHWNGEYSITDTQSNPLKRNTQTHFQETKTNITTTTTKANKTNKKTNKIIVCM